MRYGEVRKRFDVEHIIVFDIETYYDSDYSLKKLTNEQYLRSPLFELQYVSICIDDEPVQGRFADDETFGEWIRSFPWDKSLAVAHNGNNFDFAAVNWHLGIHAKKFLDTYVMSRPLAGESGSSLKSLARFYGLPEKLDALGSVEGVRLKDYTEDMRRDICMYGNHDTELCRDIFRILIEYWAMSPLLWMDYCARMFVDPRLVLDRKLLGDALVELDERKNLVLDESWKTLSKSKAFINLKTFESIFSSGAKFASLLEQLGVKVPYKESTSIKTGKVNRTPCVAKTDPFIVELSDTDDPFISCALHTREMLNSSIEKSRLEKLLDIASRAKEGETPTLPVPLLAFGARTGRNAGSGKINLQNLPSRPTKLNPKGKRCALRRSIKAPKDFNITEADFSQIEVRAIGGLSGDFTLINEFSDPTRDCYLSWGEKLDGVYRTKDAPERAIYKRSMLSLNYGAGALKLFYKLQEDGVDTSEDECKRIVYTYRNVYNRVSNFWSQCTWAIHRLMEKSNGSFGYNGCIKVNGDKIQLPSGRLLTYKNVHLTTIIEDDKEKDVFKYTVPNTNMEAIIYGSKLAENICQAVANDICVNAAINIQQSLDQYPVLQIHDSLAYLVRKDEHLEDNNEALVNIMKVPPEWLNHIPIDAEYATGSSLGDLK